MAVAKLVPAANATDTGGVLATNNYTLIDETVASADGSVNTTNADDITALAACTWTLTDLPATSAINSATFRVRARVSNAVDDTCTYRFRCIVNGVNHDILYTDVDTAFVDRTIAVTGTEAQLNAATVQLVQTLYNKTKGFDGISLSVDAFEIEVDYTAGAATVTNRTLTDNTLESTDSIIAARFRDRLAADSITATDAIVLPQGPPKAVSKARRYRNRRQTDDAVTTDALDADRLAINNVTLSDEIEFADSLEPLRLRDRSALNSIEAVDNIIAAQTGVKVRTLSDGIEVNDLLIASISAIRTVSLSDSIEVTDSFVSLRERNREAAESFDTADSSISLRERNRETVESLESIDSSTLLRERNRQAIDDIEATDSFIATSAGVKSVSLSDSIDATDFSISLRERNREAAESAETADSSISLRERNRKFIEALESTDFSTLLRERNRKNADGIEATDSFIATSAGVKSVSLLDSIETADSSISLRERNREVTDTVEATDNITATSTGTRSVVIEESLEVTDQIDAIRARVREALSSVLSTDSLATSRARSLRTSDSLALIDNELRYAERTRLLNISIDVSDSLVLLGGVVVNNETLIDSLELSDSIIATYISDYSEFIVHYGLEELPVKYGAEELYVNYGATQEIGL